VRLFSADLHIHTALSPCAENEMTPPAIIAAAKAKGVEIIGICDHNSAENVMAVAEAGAAYGITVIGGIEVQTVEDVHVLTFFRHLDALGAWQEEVYSCLPEVENNEAKFGEQLIMDSTGSVTGKLYSLLLGSTSMSVDYVGKRVRELEGLVVPAHVDRPSFSLIRNLGFVPDGLKPYCMEISRNISREQARARFPSIARFPLVKSSDAHRLSEIAGYTDIWAESGRWDEILLALKFAGGRYVTPRDTIM
jgi:PHP family Zn ribbon phosphoesterase